MNTATALDLITARQTAATEFAGQLREQIAKLTAELAQVQDELADLDTTRKTLLSLITEQLNAPDPTIAIEPYQQILAVFRAAAAPLRAKDICVALGIEVTAPKDAEGIRAKLKRLVRRQVLTEAQPGLFTLDPTGG